MRLFDKHLRLFNINTHTNGNHLRTVFDCGFVGVLFISLYKF